MINQTKIKALILILIGALSFQIKTVAGESSIPLPSANELGTVCYPNKNPRPITPDAVLWMGKMVDGETWGKATEDDARAMFWAIMQRSHARQQKYFENWRQFMQSYSQPIKTQWLKDGLYCREYYESGFSGRIPANCSLKKVTRRAENIKKGWNDLDLSTKLWVIDLAKGNQANHIPGVVGWFAPGLWKKRERNGENRQDKFVFAKEIDGNVYFKFKRTRNWTTKTVRVVASDESC